MKHIGHTEIKNGEVIFVYYELPKPYRPNYWSWGSFQPELFNKAKKEYEASRREVKVENVYWSYQFDKWILEIIRLIKPQGITSIFVKHSQPCEAEISNGKAVITKIL